MMKASLAGRFRISSGSPGRLADLASLGKPPISILVLVSTALGFMLGSSGGFRWGTFLALMWGTLLVSWGINALNHFLERDTDALMTRTRNRPLPAGRMAPESAFRAGLAATAAGLVLLYLGTNTLTTAIALLVAASYVLCYTPLKKISQLNTLVGAVPGALPPVLGWAAAGGSLGLEAGSLFLIMFVWQLPHFLPIAWLYREDFRKARLAMITVDDPSGGSTRRQSLLYTATLVLISLNPTLIGMAGRTYFFGALVLGLVFFAASAAMALNLTEARARMVLKVSVVYLPLLLGLLVYDAI